MHLHVFTFITKAETIKRQTMATCGYVAMSVTAGLGCGL